MTSIPMTRRVGAHDVLTLVDGLIEPSASDVIAHAGGEAARAEAIARTGPKLRIVVNCFALRGGDGVMLVDAGTGPAWGEALGHARAAMAAAGIAPEAVRRILLTHLHGDHALGLFDGDEPYFPNAEIVVPEADLAFFGDEEKRAETPASRRSGFDIAATLQRLYEGRIRRVEPSEVLPGIEMIPLPGHTYGHAGYLLADDAQPLLLLGDALHLAEWQAADPDLGLVYDLDGAMAIGTRRAILERSAQAGWLVAGAHFEGIRRVERRGSAYVLTRIAG